MKITPPRGMNDYLPQEVELRAYMEQTILKTYQRFGFSRIITPVMEDADNLQKSEGGENLALIYQVMKRGQKLEKALEAGEALWDLGLRYDLTLPLARYYTANQAKLPLPFKCIQIDRAERPQKGRLREFVQCDIDIVGESGIQGEMELIAVTAKALQALGFQGFTVRINDRRVLNQLFQTMGCPIDSLDTACVALDKLDKVGASGVREELEAKGLPGEFVGNLGSFLEKGDSSLAAVEGLMGATLETEALKEILAETGKLAGDGWKAEFDLTVVRGQGYYTGTIFEIACPGYSGSVAGGGRYDNMIGKFGNKAVPAVGFSIGFERIASILMEKGVAAEAARPKLALLFEEAAFSGVFAEADTLGEAYNVSILPLGKNLGKQYKRLERDGFQAVKKYGEEEIKLLTPANS